MDQLGLCVEVCRQSGWVGEAALLVLITARALWVQWRNRQLANERNELQRERASLETKVAELSMRPPAPATVLLAPHPSLASLAAASSGWSPDVANAASSAGSGSEAPPAATHPSSTPPPERDGS